MSRKPDTPDAPRRIIIPGSEPDPVTSEPSREPEPEARSTIITGESDAPGEGSRIVLPPGATLEEEDQELPEHPRLRPLEILPVRDGDQDYLLVTDPLGILSSPAILRFEVLGLLELLDGSLSLADLSALVARETKDLRAGGFVRSLIGQLDRLLLLDSPRFQREYARVREEYHALEIRQAALGGLSYPADPGEADAFLGGHFEQAARMRDAEGGAGPTAPPRALFVPHLDPRRAGPAIARGILELERFGPDPLRVVIHGVGHSLFGDLFALTRKHFETPFGKLECDTRFVDAVAERLGDRAYRSELAHRDEHSIEIQALYLKHRFRERPLTIVPILVGGFHGLVHDGASPAEERDLVDLVAAVREAESRLGGRTLHLASVDLSHVGPRFGDPKPDERILRELEEKDIAAVEGARRGDAQAWHEAIASHQDSTRVCGWGATWLMLRCADPGEGRRLHYEQSQEPTGSVVSVATLAWP